MRLTTKGRYAVTAMIDLALHESTGPVTLTDIATNQSISLSYLEQLFARLRTRGLVRGTRGPGGGYRLARAAREISVADIVTAVDEKFDTAGRGGRDGSQDGDRLLTQELWTELSRRIYGFLGNITLGEVVQWPQVREVAARQDARNPRTAEPPRSNAA